MLDNMFLNKPYDDEAMKYNWEEDLYILDAQWFLKRTGIDLNKVLKPGFISDPQKRAQLFLEQVAYEIKNDIFTHNADNIYQQFLYDCNPSVRDIIRNAMRYQAMYTLFNGDLAMYSGANVKTGQMIERNKLREAAISPLAREELSKIIPGIGVAITYQGQFIRTNGRICKEAQT